MILVDDAGEAYARIDHSPWNGCTLADFVMPFFLFIVGVAIALALKVLECPFPSLLVSVNEISYVISLAIARNSAPCRPEDLFFILASDNIVALSNSELNGSIV